MQYNKEQEQEIIKLYNQGLSYGDIAKKTGSSKSSVYRLIQKLGDNGVLTVKRKAPSVKERKVIKTMYLSKNANFPSLEDQNEKIILWHNLGVISNKEMAKRLGIPVSVVNKRIASLIESGLIKDYKKPSPKNTAAQILHLEVYILENGYTKESVDCLVRIYIRQGLYKDAVMLLDHYIESNSLSEEELETISQIKLKLKSKILYNMSKRDNKEKYEEREEI